MNPLISSFEGSALVERDILRAACWFGLVAGLVEGTALLVLREWGWLPWDVTFALPEIVWISALFNCLLFGGLGLVLGRVSRFFLRCRVMELCVFLLAFLTFFDWVSLPRRLEKYGALLLAMGCAATLTRWFAKHRDAALGFWQRSLPWVAGIAVLAFAGIQGGLWLGETRAVASLPASPPGTPNVLIIVVDTLRADHLSCYDSKRITSPNLDRIAQHGILFENAFSTCSWTLPSHASLLTGRYPHDHGAQGPDPLGEQHPTLAEVLRSRGYRTAAFSANELFFCRDKGFGRGFIRFEDHFHSIVDMAACTFYGHKIARGLSRRLCLGDDPTRRPADDINRAALDWMDSDQRRPFFVFLNYFDTHDPYLPRQPFRTKFSKSRHRGGIINGYRGRERPKMTADQLQSEIDAYDGAIAFVDEQIGLLMAELKNRALSDKTLVAITSDYGESFGEHGLVNHRNALFREVIHVPLVMRWLTQLPASVRVERPVSNASLAATVMDLIGANEVSPFPLRTLSPLWKSAAAWSEWPHPLAEMAQVKGAEVLDIRVPGDLGSMKCLVTPQWHYIHHDTLGTELFEWKNDPRETRNLVKTLAGKAVAEALASELEDRTSEVHLNGSRVKNGLYAQESVPE